MEESYDEGVATRIDSESCAVGGDPGGEALTGVRVGPGWSREIHVPGSDPRVPRGADAVERSGRPHRVRRPRETRPDPARYRGNCRTRPRNRLRRQWREGGEPRETRASKTRSGHRTGWARPVRSCGYERLPERIGGSGSRRACTMSTTSSACGRRISLFRGMRRQASTARRGGRTGRIWRPTSRISPAD